MGKKLMSNFVFNWYLSQGRIVDETTQRRVKRARQCPKILTTTLPPKINRPASFFHVITSQLAQLSIPNYSPTLFLNDTQTFAAAVHVTSSNCYKNIALVCNFLQLLEILRVVNTWV